MIAERGIGGGQRQEGFRQGAFRAVRERFVQFARFGVVGLTGLVVDTGVLYICNNSQMFDWNVTVAKICAAEVAMVNNFAWNELWTFGKYTCVESDGFLGYVRRFLVFNGICGIGVMFAIGLLHVFHTWQGWNLYLSNVLAIFLVTIWNFLMNAKFNWSVPVTNRGL